MTTQTEQALKHYAKPFRSGLTHKEKLSTERRIESDKRQAERDRTRDAWGNKNEIYWLR